MVVKGNYYGILGVPLEASNEEIKARYQELSLKNHSDKKGGDAEIFKEIGNAYKVLGNPHERLKYDLSLLKNGQVDVYSQYIESEKWGTVYRLDEIVEDELGRRIMTLLFEELKRENLIQEEISRYGSIRGGPTYKVIRKKNSRGVEEIITLCRKKIIGKKTFEEMVDYIRKYLTVIKDASRDKEIVKSAVERIIFTAGLSKVPSLTEQEVDDYEGQNEYASYYEKIEEEILRIIPSEERGLKLSEGEEKLCKVVEPLKEKIDKRREQKKQLLRGLDDWLKDGEKVLVEKVEDKQGKITNFVNNFSNYLLNNKESADYATKVISRNIQNDEKTKIENLISQLNNWKKEDEVPEEHSESTVDFVDASSVSKETKKQFVEYLDGLLFNYFKRGIDSKIPSVLDRIRNEIGKEFKNTEKSLKDSKKRGEFENARYLIIRVVCERISTTGGSDDELQQRVKKVNLSFLQLIIKELEAEGIKYDGLPADDRFKISRSGSVKTNYVKKIIEWELEILKKYGVITWRKKAIEEVKDYWNNVLAGLVRKSAKIEEKTGENWETSFNTKTTKNEIEIEKDGLITSIDNFKASEIQAQNLANSNYDALLNSIDREVDLNKDYTSLINGLDWVRLTNSRIKVSLENAWNSRKNYLVNEVRKNTEIAYDNLLKQIKEENDQSANYITQLIESLDYSHLGMGNPRTKNALKDAWTARKDYLVEMARKEQEEIKRAEEQWKKKKEEEEEKRKAKEELENGTEQERRKYQELKERIENGEEHLNYSSEIEELRLERWRVELWELLKNRLKSRFYDWEQTHSEEERLNKELEKLRNPGLLKLIFNLLEEKTIIKKLRLPFFKGENPIDGWFNELEGLLKKNNYQFLREVCGEVSDEKKEKLFSEIFSELERERQKIKTKRDFEKSDYFTKVKENEIKGYVHEIFRSVNKRLIETDEWENAMKGDFGSIMKEVEKIEKEFNSSIKTSQEKIKKVIEKLSKSIVSKAKKNKKGLSNEKKVMGSISSLVGKIEEVREAVEIAKKVIKDYSEGKNLSEEEVKKWISELEARSFKNSQEVSQYLESLVSGNSGNSGNKILVVVGIIFILVLGSAMIMRKLLFKRKK